MLLSDSACALYERLYKQGGQPLDELVEPYELDALDELRSAGLIWEAATEPGFVRTIGPMAAIERLATGWHLAFDELQQKVATLSSWLRGLEIPPWARRVESGSGNGVSLRTDEAEIESLQRDLVFGTRHECLRVETERADGAVAWSEISSPPDLTEVGAARHRSICTTSLFADEGNQRFIRRAIEAGVEYRVLPDLPASLLVSDGTALVPLAQDDSIHPRASRAALLVREPAIVALLTDYFERLWTQAAQLGAGNCDIPPQRLEILRLSATGLKDETIARSLGLSTRSVRRHMDALEQRAGASSRLALGAEAARRGWL